MVKALILVVIAVGLGACTQSVGIPCEAISVHVFEDSTIDAMTDAEVNQEQAHNETVAKLCN